MDAIELGDDILPSDVILRRIGNDLKLTIKDTADSITVQNWCLSDAYKVELIRFRDGTTWDVETMRQMAVTGTEEDDYLIGFSGADVMTGSDGNDRMYGRDGDDTLIGGPGDDTLYGDVYIIVT